MAKLIGVVIVVGRKHFLSSKELSVGHMLRRKFSNLFNLLEFGEEMIIERLFRILENHDAEEPAEYREPNQQSD
jgi:hypothetical protein